MGKEKQKPVEVPPSREVRLVDGVLEGELEAIAFAIYHGDTKTLPRAMAVLELVDERRRGEAIEQFAGRLVMRMGLRGGVIGISELREEINTWHENDVLGLPQLPGYEGDAA